MEIGNIIPHIEALIFASDKPLTSMEITELINNAFGFMEEKLTLEQIQTSLDGIIEKYASEFYPFEVRESGGGWQFLTKKDFHKTVAQLNGEKFLKRLSSAALETLAIIAYKQPITKGEIESIRGVSSDYSIQKLLEKELIVITGRNEDMPGKPLVYSTSKTFMDYFGINSAADLPKLKEVFAETLIEPTVITHGTSETLPETGENTDTPADTQPAEDKLLIVREDGQLIEHAGEQEETTQAASSEDETASSAEEETSSPAEEAISEEEATEPESPLADAADEAPEPAGSEHPEASEESATDEPSDTPAGEPASADESDVDPDTPHHPGNEPNPDADDTSDDHPGNK